MSNQKHNYPLSFYEILELLTNRKAPPLSQCHPIHRPLGTHPRLSSPMVWALPTTQGPRAQEVGPGTQQHPSTRLLGQQMHQNKKHWCRKGSHTSGAAFNACLNTCLRRVLPFLGPSKATLSRNLPNSSGVRRAEASSNVRCSNPELCWSTSVPGRRLHAHVSHRCPSAARATAVRIRTHLASPSTAGEHLNQHSILFTLLLDTYKTGTSLDQNPVRFLEPESKLRLRSDPN